MARTDIEIPIQWDPDQPSAMSANTMLVQTTPFDEIVILFGHVALPIHGPPEEQAKQAEQLQRNGIRVRTDAKIVLSIKSARNLHAFLENQLAQSR